MDKKKNFIINTVYFLFWAVLIYTVITVAAVYLLPFLIGVIISYLVQKPAEYLSLKISIKKEKCAAILSVLIFILFIVLMILLCWLLIAQFTNLIKYLSANSNQVKSIFESIYIKIENVLQKIDMADTFKTYYKDLINFFIESVTSFLSNIIASIVKKIPSVLLSCVVTVVATCYISKDYDKLLRFVNGFVKPEYLFKFKEIANIFTECFLKLIIGYFWLFLITFAQLLLGFLMFRIDNFILIAFIVALLDLLPVLGTGTVLIPWAVIEFFNKQYFLGVGLIILYLIITILRNIIEPKIIGKQIDINPLFTLIFIFIGFRLGGIVGMLFLPIIITVIFTYFKRRILAEED